MDGDLGHLCERSHCELVNHEWTQRLNSGSIQKKPPKQPSKRIDNDAVPPSKSQKGRSNASTIKAVA